MRTEACQRLAWSALSASPCFQEMVPAPSRGPGRPVFLLCRSKFLSGLTPPSSVGSNLADLRANPCPLQSLPFAGETCSPSPTSTTPLFWIRGLSLMFLISAAVGRGFQMIPTLGAP